MSYLRKNSLKDFDEAWRYGSMLSRKELDKFGKLINELSKEMGEDNKLVKMLMEIKESYE